MITYLLYFFTFVTGVLLFELAWTLVSSRLHRVRAINRRMLLLGDANASLGASAALRLERGIGPLGTIGQHIQGIDRLYTQSGLTLRLRNLVLISLAIAFVCAFAVGFWLPRLWFQLLTFIGVASVTPLFIMAVKRRRRIDQFTRQLPDALDVVVRSLNAGHPFSTAISLVARELPDPIGSEFGILSDELNYGIDIESAMSNITERVGAHDIQFLAISLSINRTTGGNLSEVLSSLSRVIRERYIMKMKIRSLSSEGRFSAKLMSVFPLLLYFIIKALAPNYFDSIWDEGIEVQFFSFCIIFTLIGNIILNRMVNFDY